MSLAAFARRIELETRPIHPDTRRALDKRWAELPEHARTPEQLLGKCAVGCEGTHGVFPKCNLTCSPCYHSADANKVRIDGNLVGRTPLDLRFEKISFIIILRVIPPITGSI